MQNNPYPVLDPHKKTLRDELPETLRMERLSFHLESGDYFPMLATLLGFVQETVQNCSCGLMQDVVPIETDTLKAARKDLMYLHRNYKIVPDEHGEDGRENESDV